MLLVMDVKWTKRLFFLGAIAMIFLAVIGRMYFVEVRLVLSGSMRNTLLTGDKILTFKNFSKIDRYDIFTFFVDSEVYVKRVIGLPGDTIRIKNNSVYINGQILTEKYINIDAHDNSDTSQLIQFSVPVFMTFEQNWNMSNFGPFVIPYDGLVIEPNERNNKLYRHIIEPLGLTLEDEYTFKENYYFMLGDNRLASTDSRVFGCISEHMMIGKASYVLFNKLEFPIFLRYLMKI